MALPGVQVYSASQREQIYRRNFIFFLLDNVLFNVAMGLIGTTTVIPDFISHLTGSKILIGLSGSLFQIGWMLPQLAIARYVIRFEHKKWWFVGPNIPVRFIILIFAGIVMALGKNRPGAILVAFLICYGLAAIGDGIVGVPWADLSGTSLDGRWRARMFGLTAAITGVTMLALSPLIGVVLSSSGPGFPNNYAWLFGAAGALFALSILPIPFVHELPGGKAVEVAPPLAEFLPQLGHVLRTDGPYRAMVITQMLTILFSMAGPFYIGFATGPLGLASDVAVPVLLAMQTIGAVIGALFYTWLGARNNLLFIRLALGIALLLPISAFLARAVGPMPLYLGFLLSGVSLSNLMISFTNWVVTYASPEKRPIYAGLFNTTTAVVSLAAPFIAGTITQRLGYETLFAVALAMGCAALFVTLRNLF